MSTKTRKSDAMKFLEDLTGGTLIFGEMLAGIRLGEEETQKQFASKLRSPIQHLGNIEKALKVVSPERAVKFAENIRLF